MEQLTEDFLRDSKRIYCAGSKEGVRALHCLFLGLANIAGLAFLVWQSK